MRSFVVVILALTAQVYGQWPGFGTGGQGGQQGGQGQFPGQGGQQGGQGQFPGQGGHWGHGQGQGHNHGGAGHPWFDQGPANPMKCPTTWVEEGGSCYSFTHGSISRDPVTGVLTVKNNPGLSQVEANNYCRGIDPRASLVTINSKAENDFLFNIVMNFVLEPEHVWIGLRAELVAGVYQWKWMSGENSTYMNWDPVEYPGAPPIPEMDQGAILFEAEPLNQQGQQIDVAKGWTVDQSSPTNRERHYFICELRLGNDTFIQPTTQLPMTPFPTGPAMTTAGGILPQGPQGPGMPGVPGAPAVPGAPGAPGAPGFPGQNPGTGFPAQNPGAGFPGQNPGQGGPGQAPAPRPPFNQPPQNPRPPLYYNPRFGPQMMQQQPARFGGSPLFEVHRPVNRPAALRQNPYQAVMP